MSKAPTSCQTRPPHATGDGRSPDGWATDGRVWVAHGVLDGLDGHAHRSSTEYGLGFVCDGGFALEQGGRFSAPARSFVVMPAGIPHATPGQGTGRYWAARFCAACLGLDESDPLMSAFAEVRAGASPVRPVTPTRSGEAEARYRALLYELSHTGAAAPERARAALVMLLAELERTAAVADPTEAHSPLARDALAFIQRRCLTPISLSDVAAAVHRSPAHVAATVKRDTGHTVGAWIAAGRVAEAATRLLHTDESVAAIGESVGWADVTHFIRQFRKAHGVTPAAYRRRGRGGHSAG